MKQAGRIRPQRPVGIVCQHKPVELLLVHPPDQIFRHAIATVGAHLVVQVITRTAGGNFNDQLRRPFHVVIRVQTRTPARCRFNAQQRVRLRLVVQVQTNCGVVRGLYPWRIGADGRSGESVLHAFDVHAGFDCRRNSFAMMNSQSFPRPTVVVALRESRSVGL